MGELENKELDKKKKKKDNWKYKCCTMMENNVT